MFDLLLPAMFVAAFAPALVYGWRIIKALLYGSDEFHEFDRLERERELRLAQGRARRLRTVRYQDEHADWQREFAALGGGCACHGGPRRSRLR